MARDRQPTNDSLTAVEIPALWTGQEDDWLTQRGRTVVLVIDDQLQELADLSDEVALQKRVCAPFNVEFEFCPACATGKPMARQGQWIATVEKRLLELRDRLAAVVLDIMFDGEEVPLNGSGIRFLERINAVVPDLPVLILTQARDEKNLRGALSHSGYHMKFANKSGDLVDSLRRFLFEHAWLAHSQIVAFSPAMRAMVWSLRQYAVERPYLNAQIPKPILFVADSGEGKTRSASLAAAWLAPLLGRNRIETVPCNAFVGKSQDAKIYVFGRGPTDPAERGQVLPSGLYAEGCVQRTANGILILDEISNSQIDFQQLLLHFIETGQDTPEFLGRSSGEYDVLCMFTAQPRHLEEERILVDLQRRMVRGARLDIPPLAQRLQDIVPMFFGALQESYESRGRTLPTGSQLEELILPEAQDWLEKTVTAHLLSVSRLSDLVGLAPVLPIGIPYLASRLRKVLPQTSSVSGFGSQAKGSARMETDSVGATTESATTLPAATTSISLETLAQNLDQFSFERLRQLDLAGALNRLQEAYARLITRYLKATLDVTAEMARGKDGEFIKKIVMSRAIKLMTGDSELTTSQAADVVKRLFGICPELIDELLADPLLKEAHDISLSLRPRGQKSKFKQSASGR